MTKTGFMRTRHRLICLLPLLAAMMPMAGLRVAHSEEEFLAPDIAFKLAARPVDERKIELTYTIAPGYYLYREQFKFAADDARLGTPVLPAGKPKFDETFQKTVEIYRDVVRIAIPVTQASTRFQLLASNQGCADKGLCYPPQQRSVEVMLTGFGGEGSARVVRTNDKLPTSVSAAAPASAETATATTDGAQSTALDVILRSGKLWSIVGVFFVAGVLLSMTPCVLPMLPILSSIIVGQGASVSRGRGFALALSYSFGMALVYTAFGVTAGLAGEGLAATLQKPEVLAAFAAVLVALALSMFGVYELRLPSALTSRLSSASHRLPGGRFAGVFAMGGVSALIVSPCVAAPLAAALVYVSQTHDLLLGGAALFALAAGMSVPLLLVGASAGALLPRAGAWMDEVKRLFGILLLAVALWTVQSALPASLVLAFWGVLSIGAAVMIAWPSRVHRTSSTRSAARRVAAAVLAAGGLMQLVGAASGGSNPLQPLAHLRTTAVQAPAFTTVRNVDELDRALHIAGRPVVLDFYADWCISCKEMERFTFVDPAVQKRMAGALLLKADVTANSGDDRVLLKRFDLFGPPGMIFFDPQGREIKAARSIGFQNVARFLETLQAAGL